jgi:hypothetical protein
MRAVWSLWTKPFRSYYSTMWASERHHLMAWVLSVETARRHFEATSLITDDEGARMLIDGIGLAFDHVSTELNALDDEDPVWWTLGKLHAYRAQQKPFVHIDSDVFLWKPLPTDVVSAAVFAQNPEWLKGGAHPAYQPQDYEQAVKALGGSLPPEWSWFSAGAADHSICCGVLGGHNTAFLNHFAQLAIDMARHPHSAAARRHLADERDANLLIEQYLLAACIDYHRRDRASPFAGLEVRYLFDSFEESFNPERTTALGYTHLLSGAKHDRTLSERLERRVARDYPEYHARCCKRAPNGHHIARLACEGTWARGPGAARRAVVR